MPDIYKAIKALTIERECVSRDCDCNCESCDLAQDRDWLLSAYDDALELLKEQEPVEPRYVMICDNRIPLCGNCDGYLYTLYHHCPKCGRTVKWDAEN